MAAVAVWLFAAVELWNYRQWVYLPTNEPGINKDNRVLILQDRMDLLRTRVKDMELLVLILLGTSGLYAIVFVLSSHLSATSFSRQASETISHVQDQIGLAMGDLRELQERTEQSLKGVLVSGVPASSLNYDQQIAEIAARLAVWQNRQLTEESKLELLRDESVAAHLDAVGGPAIGAPLPTLYLGFARIYAASDPSRSRFYLDRALRLAPPKSSLASEIHYELACRFAASHDFGRAIYGAHGGIRASIQGSRRTASKRHRGRRRPTLRTGVHAAVRQSRERSAAEHEHWHRLKSQPQINTDEHR